MYSYLKKMEENIKAGGFTENDESWAEALVAKIGDLYDQDTAKGIQCHPDNEIVPGRGNVCSKISNNFEDFSLKLNSDYAINDNVKYGSSVMLAIADYGHYEANRGGYHVKVTRSCEYINGEKLYVYLGDNPPKDLHGVETDDFKVVGERVDGKDKHTILDVISGEHFQNGECKKIYFGIDVSNVEKDDITD